MSAEALTPVAEPVLTLSDVRVSLARREVLRGISLEVSAGEIVGILGANGAGKTTLLRTALGLIRADSGSVHVGSVHSRTVNSPRATSLGYVPQKHSIDWDFPMTVEDLVMTGRSPVRGVFGRIRVEDVKAVRRALGRVELVGLERRPIAELSGGQRQRALIARALSLEPRVLLLDEPFTGVDVTTQEQLTALLTSLAEEGTAILMTTHDLPQAAEICTRLCLMDGTLRADGTPAEVLEDPALAEIFGHRAAERMRLATSDSSAAPMSIPEPSARKVSS